MHDLIHLYAAELAQQDGGSARAQALDRLLNHYGTTMKAAHRLIEGGPGDHPTGSFGNRTQAMAWLVAERVNLTAAVKTGVTTHPRLAMGMTFTLSHYLTRWGYFDDAIAVNRTALVTARTVGDEYREARFRNNLGIDLALAGRPTEALEEITESVRLSRELARADPAAYEPELGRTLANLAVQALPAEQRRAAAQEAVTIARRWATAADPIRRDVELAGALDNLSLSLSGLGQHREALAPAGEAVEIRRRQAQLAPGAYEPYLGEVLLNLSLRLSHVGHHDEALAAAEEAVTLLQRLASCDATAHRPQLPSALGILGLARLAVGQFDNAVDTHSLATSIARDLGAHNDYPELRLLGTALARGEQTHRQHGGRHRAGQSTSGGRGELPFLRIPAPAVGHALRQWSGRGRKTSGPPPHGTDEPGTPL